LVRLGAGNTVEPRPLRHGFPSTKQTEITRMPLSLTTIVDRVWRRRQRADCPGSSTHHRVSLMDSRSRPLNIFLFRPLRTAVTRLTGVVAHMKVPYPLIHRRLGSHTLSLIPVITLRSVPTMGQKLSVQMKCQSLRALAARVRRKREFGVSATRLRRSRNSRARHT
jgi:hypothetical protein